MVKIVFLSMNLDLGLLQAFAQWFPNLFESLPQSR